MEDADLEFHQPKTHPLVDFAIGLIKMASILSIPMILLVATMPGGNCRGDCAVGVAMAAGLGFALFGPLLAMTGLVIAFFFAMRWTEHRGMQVAGAIAFIPMAVAISYGLYALHERRETQRRVEQQSLILDNMKPEYLSRSLTVPFGEIERLGWGQSDRSCSEECYTILANGLASTFFYFGVNEMNTSQKSVKRVFRISESIDCNDPIYTVTSSLEYFQSKGIFDACVIEIPVDGLESATLVRGFEYDSALLRPHGLPRPMVAQRLISGTPGPELMRWEYGTLPGTGEKLGTPFSALEFVRALTGVKTDRLGDLDTLTHRDRIEHALSEIGTVPPRLHSVFEFVRGAKDNLTQRGERLMLTTRDIEGIRRLGMTICAKTPEVKKRGYLDEKVDCKIAYRDIVRSTYPNQTDALAF